MARNHNRHARNANRYAGKYLAKHGGVKAAKRTRKSKTNTTVTPPDANAGDWDDTHDCHGTETAGFK